MGENSPGEFTWLSSKINLAGAAGGSTRQGRTGPTASEQMSLLVLRSPWLQRENSQPAQSKRSGKQITCPTSCQVRFINRVILKTQLSVEERGSWALPDCCLPRGRDARLVLRLLCTATAEAGDCAETRTQVPVFGKGFFWGSCGGEVCSAELG